MKDGVPVEFRKRLAPELATTGSASRSASSASATSTARRFAAIVARYVDEGRADQPHEEAIRDLLLAEPAMGETRGVEGLDIADVTGLPWIEIDFPQDVTRAIDDVLPRIGPSESRFQR